MLAAISAPGAEAPRRLVNDDGAAGLAHGRAQRLAVERRDREEIDDLGLDAVLFLQDVGGLPRRPHHGPVGDQGEVASLADDLRLADGQRLRSHPARPRGPHGRAPWPRRRRRGRDRGWRETSSAARGARPGGDHHLEAGDVGVELLLGLRVMLERAHPAAVGHADDHGAGEAALRAHAVARGVVLDLVKALEGEARELDLADGLEPVEGHAHRGPHDGCLGQGAVDDALAPEGPLQIVGHPEDAAVHPDVLADDDDVAIPLHLLHEGEVEGLDHVEPGHGQALRAAVIGA